MQARDTALLRRGSGAVGKVPRLRHFTTVQQSGSFMTRAERLANLRTQTPKPYVRAFARAERASRRPRCRALLQRRPMGSGSVDTRNRYVDGPDVASHRRKTVEIVSADTVSTTQAAAAAAHSATVRLPQASEVLLALSTGDHLGHEHAKRRGSSEPEVLRLLRQIAIRDKSTHRYASDLKREAERIETRARDIGARKWERCLTMPCGRRAKRARLKGGVRQ